MSKKKKIIALVLATVVIISALAVVVYNEFYKVKPIAVKETVSLTLGEDKDVSDINLVAHRGLSGIAPENTMAAIKAACDAGYYGVEFDIHLTSDGEWVISHDDNLRRMAGVNKKICEMTLKEIQSIELNNGANIEKYDGITVPTLREVLNCVSKTDIVPVIEIKTTTEDKIDTLVAMLKEYDYLESARIISFNQAPLKEYKRICSRTPMSLLVEEINDENISFCIENDIDAISFNHKKADKDLVQKIIDAQLTPQTWTVDSLESLSEFVSYGVKTFTTNCITPQESK